MNTEDNNKMVFRGLLILNIIFWVNVYFFGFFQPFVWTMVLSAIVGLWLRLTGRG